LREDRRKDRKKSPEGFRRIFVQKSPGWDGAQGNSRGGAFFYYWMGNPLDSGKGTPREEYREKRKTTNNPVPASGV